MAVSLEAGYTGGGIKLTCILDEGAPTVTKNTMGQDGYFDTGIVWASQMAKNQFVCLDTDTANTYAATGGLPAVQPIAAGSLIVGQIISEPRIIKVPLTTAAGDSYAKRLAGKYYRVATVEFFGISGVAKAVVVNTTTAIVPGVAATLKIDASASNALAAVDPQGPVCLSCVDATSGGSGVFSFHYIAGAAGTVSALVGFVGGVAVIQE